MSTGVYVGCAVSKKKDLIFCAVVAILENTVDFYLQRQLKVGKVYLSVC